MTLRRCAPALVLAVIGVAGCTGGGTIAPPSPLATSGPAADYPVTVGAPYTIAGKTFEPNDTLNYDEVGQAVAGPGEAGITAAHHTLPVPAYVEVTALTTGRTILARIERRGPMDSTALVALSPDALDQLGAHAPLPVRVRRVNPPEVERAALRQGKQAPMRMATPMSLVEVLRRRLPTEPVRTVPVAVSSPAANAAPPPVSGSAPRAEPDEIPAPLAGPIPTRTPAAPPALSSTRAPAPTAPPRPTGSAAPAAQTTGRFVVQAATFSTQQRATSAARAFGGSVERAGRYWRVRTGPFPTRAAAEASLAKVKAAGYSDARIQTAD